MFVGFDAYDRGMASFIKTIEEAQDFIYSEDCDSETEDIINYAIEEANNAILKAIRMRRVELNNEV